MELDKTTVGLSLILAVVVAMLVFSASLPVSGTDSEQQATVTKNTTAIVICAQNGSADHTVTYWNFSGQAGATVDNPTNSLSQTQNTSASNEPVACLNNTNAQIMTVYMTPGTFGGTVVNEEHWDDGATPVSWSGNVQGSSDVVYGTVATNNHRNLWLRVILQNEGSGTSTFNVTCEV